MDDKSESALKSGVGREPFFRRIDWSSFWTATAISFVVYFFSLGPSVSLEDSGELAVAGDHLGVPHPPGYPIWTIISWVFARVFSFVTFRGQPTPAWSIALGSAVFGALAAGCTAMLITRSASDMLAGADDSLKSGEKRRENMLCWVGGVAGSLIFAFSPVMWSQSTIVEVYALGAFFLMLVMLLTYRWMRQPSDKLLWLTAFVFGLGLTNYQVLLLAALPLVTIIFLRNVALFRDFLLTAIPLGIGALLLNVASNEIRPGLIKRLPLTGDITLPNMPLTVAALAIFGLTLVAFVSWPFLRKNLFKSDKSRTVFFIAGIIATFLMFCLMCFAGTLTTTVKEFVNPDQVTLLPPVEYHRIASYLLVAALLPVLSAVFPSSGGWRDPWVYAPLLISVLFAIIAFSLIGQIPAAELPAELRLALAQSDAEVFNLGRVNAVVIAALIFMLALALTTPRGICLALPAAAVELSVLYLINKGAMMGLTHPTTWWFIAPLIFNFLLLFLAAIALPNGRSVAMTIFATELGVSFYAYMPIVSDLRNPPMNWGYPRTWDGFKHAISRGQYEKIAPADIFTPDFMNQCGNFFSDLRKQFTLLIVPFGILPFTAWRTSLDKSGNFLKKPLVIAFALFAFAAGFWFIDEWIASKLVAFAPEGVVVFVDMICIVLLIFAMVWAIIAGALPMQIALFFIATSILFVWFGNIPQIEKVFDDSRIDKLALVGLSLLCLPMCVMLAFRQLFESFKNALRSRDGSQLLTVGTVILAVAVIVCLIAFNAVMAALPQGTRGQTFMVAVGTCAIMIAGVWLCHFVVSKNLVRNSLDNISRQWLIGTLLNFFVMSILLIALANPKGDLQDTFIQKVKFISSHGLFALWLGYGFIFAVIMVCALSRRIVSCGEGAKLRVSKELPTVIFYAAIVLILLTPLIPIRENFCNSRLVFELGAAEQTNHDYGWQFGNYQLRGADAITEELEADEEPLPNPSYPPAMGKNAVFFGGTDPGRFVPTYMIYSADVRPDVFLITQNALADKTFMSVTRDLYGDQIWIPTPDESASAFRIYIDEVESGKRPRNAELITDSSGQVQVVGALGVMEINGILCKMIFERNKALHNFYVEESYVIPWMYPYLTPHGLIMRINSEQTLLQKDNIDDDMDFWDWYVRRLTRDDRYRRDLVAQKSFSKLRSALGGLYVARGKWPEAEEAYVEARTLYSVSPEATFRMVQDIYLRQGRWQEAIDTIEEFQRLDPNNLRAPLFMDHVSKLQRTSERISRFNAKLASGGEATTDEILDAAVAYLNLGDNAQARKLLLPLAERKLTVNEAADLARMLLQAGDSQKSASLFKRMLNTKYVSAQPDLLLQAFHALVSANQIDDAHAALTRYLTLRPKDWENWVHMAALEVSLGNPQQAIAAMRMAEKYGKERAMALINSDETLRQFLQKVNSLRSTTPNGFPK